MSDIKISKVTLKINENEFELSLEEIYNLKKFLNENYPEYIPSTPIIIKRYPQPWQPDWRCPLTGWPPDYYMWYSSTTTDVKNEPRKQPKFYVSEGKINEQYQKNNNQR